MEEKEKRFLIRNIDKRKKAFNNMELKVFLVYVLPMITPLFMLVLVNIYNSRIFSLTTVLSTLLIALIITLFSEFDNFRKETVLQLIYEYILSSKVVHIENFRREEKYVKNTNSK